MFREDVRHKHVLQHRTFFWVVSFSLLASVFSDLKSSHKINECSSRLDTVCGILFLSLMSMLPSVVFCLKVCLAGYLSILFCEEQGGDGVDVNCHENSNLC